MTISRRMLLAGLGAGLGAPAIAAAEAGGGVRRYAIIRGGDAIGSHVHEVRLEADGTLEVAVDIEIRIKAQGLVAYHYEMRNRESWTRGRLLSMTSATGDDGAPDYAGAAASGEELEIDGSGFQGMAPGDAATTTYWTPAFLERRTWINSQTGAPISVTATRIGDGGVDTDFGRIATEKWAVTGRNFNVVLHYADREWVSIEFDAGGVPARYVPEAMGPALAPLWEASL